RRLPPSALPLVAFDEFTSVVDRNVARIGSAAVAKAVRTKQIQCKFVAVTCHYDILEWLAPDWVIDMANREFVYYDQQPSTTALAAVERRAVGPALNPEPGTLNPIYRRRLRRPAIQLQLHRCRHALWRLFARHHYLSAGLSKMARCFVALWQGQ